MTSQTAVNETETRFVEHVMGMPITLVLRGRHAHSAAGRRAWTAIVELLHDVDRKFSTYRSDSEVSLVRDHVPHDASVELREVLALAEEARVASDGAFNVWLPCPEGRLVFDPSGVVKGWAIDGASRLLDDLEETDTCLSAGGDMVCRTRVPGSEGWKVGIENPFDPQRIIAVLPVVDGAVATSGTAHRGEHLVDARTGLAPAGVASVTVVTASLTWADIDATAAYAQGTGAARWLSTRPNRTALIVWADGTTSAVRTR
ncbi:FAD:protein FMN transferase [soil metagenome]